MDTSQVRILMTTVVSSLLILVLAPARADAVEALRIREVSIESFPKVELVVSSPDAAHLDEVVVSEDHQQIDDVAIEPLGQSGQVVDVVLVIDSSGSMQGKPMKAAISAARSFVKEVPDNVRVGVVSFSDRARKVAALGTQRADLIGVINEQVASGETALFDGVRTAARMFNNREAQRNIVLLSDGGDTASNSNLNSAVAEAKRSGAAIFSVGLKTTETDIDALKTLSSSSGGRYQPAATADLSAIYDALAAEIAGQFAITFTSKSDGGGDVRIAVESPSGTDVTNVLVPMQAPKAPEADKELPTPAEPVPAWVLPTALSLSFAAVFVLALSLLATRGRRRREARLRSALHDIAGATGHPTDLDDDSAAAWLPDMFVTAGGKVAERGGLRESLDAKLERASLAMKPEEFIGISLVAALGGYLTGSFLFGNAMVAIVLTILAAVGPTLWLGRKIKKRLAKINDQIPDVLGVLAGSLRAGQSFLQALETAAREVDEPAAEEFQRVLAEIRLGRSVTEALDAMAARVDSEGFTWAILAVNIQREVGGNLAELLDKVSETLRTRETLKRQIKTLSAEGRLSMYILTALPFVIGLYMSLVNPAYIGLLFTTQIGIVLLVTGMSLLVAGFFWMRKVVDIDV